MRLLVTGGAGYIGSHMVQLRRERGHWVRVLDDLSSGQRALEALQPGTAAPAYDLGSGEGALSSRRSMRLIAGQVASSRIASSGGAKATPQYCWPMCLRHIATWDGGPG